MIGPASTPRVIAGKFPNVGVPGRTVKVVVALFASKLPLANCVAVIVVVPTFLIEAVFPMIEATLVFAEV